MRSVRFFTGIAMFAGLVVSPSASADAPFVVPIQTCGFSGPAPAQEGPHSGQLQGIVTGGSQARPVTSVYLLCTIQVGALESAGRHSGANTVVATAWGMAVATVNQPVSYLVMQPGQRAFLCMETWLDLDDGHLTLFMNADTGEHVTSPEVPCQDITSQ